MLGENDRGSMTSASPTLYPHQWSWDAAFVAIGLAKVSVPRALTELATLLRAQWRTGMLPHIVFAPDIAGYTPGPELWRSSEVSRDAPRSPQTSGLIQPPVHGIAVARIVGAARAAGGGAEAAADEFLAEHWDGLISWHRYLAERRDPEGTGLITIYHGWESGLDNSPRWDDAYSRVVPGELPEYRRSDRAVVADSSQRPTDSEYDRYLWLVLQLRAARYADAEARRTVDFLAADTFMSAIFAAANDELALLAAADGRPEAEELAGYADRFRAGVLSTVDENGWAVDLDLRAGLELRSGSMSGFAGLLSGGLPADRLARLLATLDSPGWCGNRALRYPAPPSTTPGATGFDRRSYWRGPQWPVMSWLFGWALDRIGETARAERIREATLAQLAGGEFAEYYEPFTGEPLGSLNQSWTAAAALDWLL